MAAKIRGLGRLLLALTLLGWGQFVFASTLVHWQQLWGNPRKAGFASADAACSPSTVVNRPNASVAWCSNGNNVSRIETTCQWGDNSGSGLTTGLKCNDSCDAPSQMVGGQCVTPEPEPDCSAHLGELKFAAVDCSASPSGTYTTPSVVSITGAEYVSAPQVGFDQRVKKNLDGSGTGICVARYQGSGKYQASSDGVPGVPDGAFADASPSAEGPPCFDFGGSELCLSADNAGCGVYKGTPWCYKPGDTCGEIKGEFTCLPNTSRQCTYVGGKMECISTGNPPGTLPPSVISPNSPDHPIHGGNADGNDRNDPKTSQQTGGGGGGGDGLSPNDLDALATNKSVTDLGDKVDQSNNILQDILDLLNGEGTDDSGASDGSPTDAEAEGADLGKSIAEALGTQMESVDEKRNEEIEGVLDQLPNQVERWFGSDMSAVGLDFIDTIVPQPVACTNYVVPLNLGKYAANLPLPICTLMPYKPLLEWVIWCLTAIGAFRIGYSALRQDDAKAVRGGY